MTIQAQNETSLARPEAGLGSILRTQKILTAGGVLGALAASSCCIVPLVLFGLGVSGAWIGNLTQLAPYQPYFIAATVACLGGGYWLRSPLTEDRLRGWRGLRSAVAEPGREYWPNSGDRSRHRCAGIRLSRTAFPLAKRTT